MTNILKVFLKAVENREAIVGVIGLGYVGLPLALRFCDEGFRVYGFDIDSEKVQHLRAGISYMKHIPSQDIQRFVTNRKLVPTDDFSLLSKIDAVLICVPTPLTPYREPDLSFLLNTVQIVASQLRPGQLISIESTTYPGTTEEEVLPRLQSKDLKVGRDFFLVYSPERQDPGNNIYGLKDIPKVVGGVTRQCLEAGKALYGAIIEKIVPTSSPSVAEMTKLLENIYRAVNIALVNELKILCDKMGIDIWEVIEAAKTKPFGFQAFYPGPGLGGHCIPIDPFYLAWRARRFDLNTRFIELAGEINSYMPNYVVEKTIEALSRQSKAIKGAKILILGVAYKKDVDDLRESPALKIIELLKARGAKVDYNDPYFPRLPRTRHYDFQISSVSLTPEHIAIYDCIIIVTDHSSYDYELLRKHAKLIVDTRGVYREPSQNVLKA